MRETIKNYVNVCIKKDDQVLLLDRQHDDFKGWIQPGGKVEFPESFFEAAVREVKEETGLTVLNLQLKGISGFTNPIGNERYVYYDFLCEEFDGEVLKSSPEGTPKWWQIDQLDQLDMQDDIRERLPLYWRKGSFERIHYWDEENHCISHTKEILYD
ncbi:8-oxo-dGTP diphosphatase [Streptococcus respiraculi]|uniref:8-oxo-dGTP diphosphatase n=1 Tax=Streptococcus respiraculi TaxID=2021971 RepID=UPI000E70B9DC|nr:8-oxo-dGTP diphosphatase [Streptococcus respiraculi]